MGRTVWNPVLVSIASGAIICMGAPRANSTTASAHTPLFLFLSPSIFMCLSFCHHAFSFQLSLSLFYLWYFGISLLSSHERLLPLFPSVVVLSFSAPSSESPGIRTLQFSFCCCSIFHTVVCFTLLFISSIILFLFYLENDGRKMAALLPVGYYF